MKKVMAVATSMFFALVMACGLVGCGGGVSVSEQPAVVVPAEKTGAVKLRIDLNQQSVYKSLAPAKVASKVAGKVRMAKSVSKTAALTVEETQIVNALKSEVSFVRILVYNATNWVQVSSFSEKLVNGVFDSMRPNGTSLINLPEGEYQIYVGLENADDEARFYGYVDITVVAGLENAATMDLEVSPIQIPIAIANFQGNFDKGDGDYQAPFYGGYSSTDDWMDYWNDEDFAWMDEQGTLHATVQVNPLVSTKAWVTVKDKDGTSIVQVLDIDMLSAVTNLLNGLETTFVFEKTSPVTINVNFPG